MKSNTRKKILALFAITAMSATAAWAAVSASGVITTSPVTDGGTNLDAVGPPAADGFTVGGTGATLESDTTLRNIGTTTLTVYTNNRNYAGTDGWDRLVVGQQDGMIAMTDAQVLTLKPGNDANTPKRLMGNGAIVGGVGAGGVLRINGGTTNIYGGDANNPTDASTMNTYDGGTFLRKGRLNVAHSNALGLGPLTLAEDTTFGVIETDNIDVGQAAPDQKTLNNVFDPKTGVYPAGNYAQNITVARYDDNKPIQATRDVTFDTPAIAETGKNATLKVYAGIIQPFENRHPVPADADPRVAVKVAKTGVGTMDIDTHGMRHLGGTHVKKGLLSLVQGANTRYYNSELGSTWFVTPGGNITNTLAADAVVPKETVSAKVNYDAYLGGLQKAVVFDAHKTSMTMADPGYTGSNFLSGVPAYMNSFTSAAADDMDAPSGAGFVNPLTIDEDATVKINRDQFFGDLNGAGTLDVDYWAKGSAKVIPQVTMMLNNTLSAKGGAHANFSGLITGSVNLVLDNPVQAIGRGVNDNQGTIRVNYFPRTQKLSSENSIAAGDTFVKDGTLSIKNSSSIGPDTLRIGMYDAGYTNDDEGVKSGSESFRGFGSTQNFATLHGDATFTLAQKTLVYVPGLYTGGQLAPLATDSTVPSLFTRSVTWFGNNPENVSNATSSNLVGQDGQYNTVGPSVNLAASRGATISYPDVTFYGQNRASYVIAQISGKSNIRYNMMNAISINEKFDENPNWAGTIALSDSWDLAGADASRMFGFDVKAGTLQMSEVQKNGYALVGVRQGATLRLGNNARSFGDLMEVVVEDDARICVKPQTTDLAASLADAQTKDAVFTADSINYTGLGMGDDHKDKRIVVQVDLSNISNSITDQWIKVVGSNNAANWNNIHYYDSSAGQTEHLYKVKIAQPDSMVFDGNYSVTPYADENQYNIYVHIKKIDQPTTSSNFTFSGSSSATNSEISGSITLRDNAGVAVASTDVTFYLFSGTDTSDNTTALESVTVPTDESGVAAYAFTEGGYGNGQTYTVKAVATGYDAGTATVTTTGAQYSSSSSSGCDAGFGAFALLAMAGGALVLRRKD